MKRGWGMRLKASVLFSAIAVLLAVACTESPTNSDPPDPEPERTPSLRLIAPIAGQRVISGDTMDIAWEIVLSKTETRGVVKDSGSAEIQYTVLGGQPEWRMVNVVPASLQQYRWKVPANLQQDYALRLRLVGDTTWSVVSPLHVGSPELRCTSPDSGGIYRLRDGIPIRWVVGAPVGNDQRIECQYLAYGGWEPIGQVPVAEGGFDWQPPVTDSRMYSIRLRAAGTADWVVVKDVKTADIRIRDIAAGSSMRSGTPLEFTCDVDVYWDSRKQYNFALSTNGGITWSPGLQQHVLLAFPRSTNCLLRAWRDDLPFADTSAVFTITEDLADYAVLRVGETYVYEYMELVWEVIAGGTHITPKPHPDIHVNVRRQTAFADRIEYDVIWWTAGSTDTNRTTITETLSGHHPIEADFLPFSMPRIFARLDATGDAVTYSWEGNYPITIHRQRGLTNARYYTGRYPNASEHVFRLLP